MTLMEVLLVSVLMLIVLGATLTTFNTFERKSRDNQNLNEAQDQARRALDLMARDLRNLASPTPLLPLAVDREEPARADLPVRGQGQARRQPERAEHDARALLPQHHHQDRSTGRSRPGPRAAAPAIPASACGTVTGWASTIAVATDVVNGTRPVFAYNAVDARQDHRGERPGLRRHDADQAARGGRSPDVGLPAQSEPRPDGGVQLRSRCPAAASSSTRRSPPTPRRRRSPSSGGTPSFTPDGKVGEGIVLHLCARPARGSARCTSSCRDATLDTTSDTKTVCANGPGVTCP